jgi:hypothetical protein
MEDSSFKNRNMLVLVFEVFLIVVAIGGLTFATTRLINGSSTIIKFGEYNVDYVGETEIVVSELEPISDSLINYDTKDGVVRLEFSLRGVETNEKDDLIYDIMVSDMNIDCSLLNEYTKWNLYKNGELLSNGNFSPKFDGNVLTDNFRLTEIQEDLPSYNEAYDNYVLIILISETCEDLANCERIDQTLTTNSVMDMKIFIALLSGEKKAYERIPNNDPVCLNKPVLYDGMIPVYYDGGNWKIADKNNGNASRIWYNYSESKWANAVFVNTDKYNDSKLGTIVEQEDILGYYVWIPRFKYKLWNVENTIGDSYDAYNKGIDIIFESGVHSTGKGVCEDYRCAGKNNQYLTHPAFSDNLRGFWISKYEIGLDNKFIPNVESLRNKTLDEYKDMIGGLSTTYNIQDSVDSHVVSNLEWGATLYLSHSKYGLCKENKCDSFGTNDTYISESDKGDTTTRNVYGVYDMSGASAEYALGSKTLGSGITEVLVSENETWYKGSYIDTYGEYTLRGGVERSMFSISDIGMFDVSTRSVLVSKQKDLAIDG